MPEPADGVVLQFPSARGKSRARATPATLPITVSAGTEPSLADTGKALFDAPTPYPSEPATPRPKPKTKQRPKTPAKPRHSPEHKRALEITAIYKMTQPVCDEPKAAFAIRTAILSGLWPDEDIVAAVERVADSGYPLTSNSLSYQLQRGRPAEWEVDPVIHQAVDAALEHLGRLDSKTMTETEQALAAAEPTTERTPK